MGYTYQDLADLYCCSKRTIERRTAKFLPLFKNFDLKKRKRSFSYTEAQIIIQELGIPPKTEQNKQIIALFSLQK